MRKGDRGVIGESRRRDTTGMRDVGDPEVVASGVPPVASLGEEVTDKLPGNAKARTGDGRWLLIPNPGTIKGVG